MNFKALTKAAIHILQTPKPSQNLFAARVCLPNPEGKAQTDNKGYM